MVGSLVGPGKCGIGNVSECRRPLSYPKQVGQGLSTSAFAKPVAVFYGNAGRGTIIGPGMIVFDTGLYKDFAVTERRVFELRGEIFNTFNHTNFSSVNTAFGSPTFGFVQTAREPRIIELGCVTVSRFAPSANHAIAQQHDIFCWQGQIEHPRIFR
jgi:hypothetical protein